MLNTAVEYTIQLLQADVNSHTFCLRLLPNKLSISIVRQSTICVSSHSGMYDIHTNTQHWIKRLVLKRFEKKDCITKEYLLKEETKKTNIQF